MFYWVLQSHYFIICLYVFVSKKSLRLKYCFVVKIEQRLSSEVFALKNGFFGTKRMQTPNRYRKNIRQNFAILLIRARSYAKSYYFRYAFYNWKNWEIKKCLQPPGHRGAILYFLSSLQRLAKFFRSNNRIAKFSITSTEKRRYKRYCCFFQRFPLTKFSHSLIFSVSNYTHQIYHNNL